VDEPHDTAEVRRLRLLPGGAEDEKAPEPEDALTLARKYAALAFQADHNVKAALEAVQTAISEARESRLAAERSEHLAQQAVTSLGEVLKELREIKARLP
jgi:hypothetical protein